MKSTLVGCLIGVVLVSLGHGLKIGLLAGIIALGVVGGTYLVLNR